MPKNFLLVDGENFFHKVDEILIAKKIDKKKVDLTQINLKELFEKYLPGYKLKRPSRNRGS